MIGDYGVAALTAALDEEDEEESPTLFLRLRTFRMLKHDSKLRGVCWSRDIDLS